MNNKRRLRSFSVAPVAESATHEELVRAFNEFTRQQHEQNKRLAEQAEAQAGIRGTVVAARQKKRDSRDLNLLSISLEGGRGGDCDDPVDPTDIVNKRYLDEKLKCSNLVKILEQCLDLEDFGGTGGESACDPFELTNQKRIDMAMTGVFAIDGLGEFVYAAGTGVSSTDPELRAYRVSPVGNAFSLVSTLVLTEPITSMILHGHYLLGCEDGGSDLVVIDIKKPDDPEEVAVFALGASARQLHPQGRYAYVATDAGVRIVDLSVPSAPVTVGTAS